MEMTLMKRRLVSRFMIAALLLWNGVSFAAKTKASNQKDEAEKELKILMVGSEKGKRATRSKQVLQLDWPFGSGMVLQNGCPIGIAGNAIPSTPVVLSFAGQQHKTQSDAAGRWQITLDPLKISHTPQDMKITAGKEQTTLKDILVGEVWMISGQSNMECTANTKLKEFKTRAKFYGGQVPELKKHIDPIEKFNDPEIRYATIRRYGFVWKKCVGKDAMAFSLVGMFFARRLYQTLKVPIGIVNVSYGCASIETYLPEEELAKGGYKDFVAESRAYQELLKKGGPSTLDPETRQKMMLDHCLRWEFCRRLAGKDKKVDPKHYRTVEWHMGLVKPGAAYYSTVIKVEKYPVRGMLWYQGGTNVADKDYHLRLKLLIEAMRRVTGNRDLPFYIVMITPRPAPPFDARPRFWAQQFDAAASMPNTWIVNTADTAPNEQRDYHPTTKDFIGERLAVSALNCTYNHKDIIYSSPIFDHTGNAGANLLVSFRHAKGLHTKDGKAPTCFEIAGADRKFVPATAVIEGDKVRLSSPGVSSPKYARFAWAASNPGINLVSGAGLPPFPFDSSDPFFQSGKHRQMNR